MTGCIVQSFFNFSLVHSTVGAQLILYMLVQSEVFYTSTVSILISTIPCNMGPESFVIFYISMFFFFPFIMFIGWVVHVHSIKFPFHLVPGVPPQILDTSSSLVLCFLDYPGFKVGYTLNITLVGLLSFSVGAGLCFWFLLLLVLLQGKNCFL